MNVNFGLMPPLTGPRVRKGDRKKLYTERAREAFDAWAPSLRAREPA
jgi:methylenetetrahydrofolate--tRNA-(uracil-5-)-methyltransferase